MYVSRRQDGTIYGAWTVRQHPGQEELADESAELVAFLTPAAPAKKPTLDDVLEVLEAHGPAEIKAAIAAKKASK